MMFIILYAILIPTIIISIIALRNEEIFDKLKFNPSHIEASKEWYRFFSYGIIHGDYLHLFINMYVLWSFGKIVVYDFTYFFGNYSNLLFLALYIPALGISVIPSFIKQRDNVFYNAIGASGAVSAVVYASIILNPNAGLGFILIPISLPAWLFGTLYLVYTYFMSKKENTKIGHSSHMWGALYGLLFMLIAEPKAYIYFFQQIFS